MFFIDFPIFGKICRKMIVFGRKIYFSPFFRQKNAYPNFAGNFLLLQYWPYWSNFWYKCSLWYLGTFDPSNFCQKKPLLATLRSHKKTKNQNIKNLTDQKFLNITRNIYTKNWTNRANIEGVGNFLRSWGIHFFAEKTGTKSIFWQKTVIFQQIFPQIWKSINTT